MTMSWTWIKTNMKEGNFRLVLCCPSDVDQALSQILHHSNHVIILRDLAQSNLRIFINYGIPIRYYNKQINVFKSIEAIETIDQTDYCGIIYLISMQQDPDNLDTIRKLSFLIPTGYRFHVMYYVRQFIAVPVFGGAQKSIKNGIRCIILPNEGYGDAFYTLPFWKHYVRQIKKQGRNIVFHHTTSRSLQIYRHLFPSCKHLMEPFCSFSGNLSSKLEESHLVKYEEVIDLTYASMLYPPLFDGYDKIELLCYLLHYPHEPSRYYRLKRPPISERPLRDMIENFKTDFKYIIGIHLRTIHDMNGIRNWPNSYVQKFLQLCHASGIGIINFAPGQTVHSHVLNLSHLSVVQLIPVVGILDAMVGIDSCFCHLAGILGIDNITIWGGGTPYYSFQYQVKIGVRPFSSNFSIASHTGDIRRIGPDIVHIILNKLLYKELRTTPVYLPYGDKRIEKDLLWVDEQQR